MDSDRHKVARFFDKIVSIFVGGDFDDSAAPNTRRCALAIAKPTPVWVIDDVENMVNLITKINYCTRPKNKQKKKRYASELRI